MDRIKEIDISIDVNKRIVYNRSNPVLSYFDTNTSFEFVELLEDIIHENKRLREALYQIKYEYEQGTDDKVSYRMYMESVQTLREDS